ncbi:MAG: UDP-2,3-diacylglucosamine diphosphatase [Pseudomonadota bacterium]
MSDLHLERSRPDITEQWLAYLSGPARQADALYLLGDLFETWLGDDAIGSLERAIADALLSLNEHGVAVFFICGNRDFLLGDDYCQRAGMMRLTEPVLIDLYNVPTLLLHGDTLCTGDIEYQRYRTRVRDPEWQRQVLSRPRWVRRTMAYSLRTISRLRTRGKKHIIMDVNHTTVLNVFEQSQATRMIHGHTHRPGHHLYRDGRYERIVLGDWEKNGSVLSVSSDEAQLIVLNR